MATSGTTTTVFKTRRVLDEAYRLTKVAPELISGEKIDSALAKLWVMLSAWSSRGAPIWKFNTLLEPLYQGQGAVTMPGSVIEVLNANLRTLQRLTGLSTSSEGFPVLAFDGDLETSCTQLAAAGNIVIDFGNEFVVTTFGLLPTVSGSWDFFYEVSTDGVTWETVFTFVDQVVVARQWLWTDVAITRYPAYQYARIRADVGTVLDVIEWFVGNTPSAIPMAPLNHDDWFNLPNKSFQGRPVQFWQDMQRDAPVLRVWPVPNAAANFQQLEVQVHSQIEDVGMMAQELDIPRRWYEPVIWNLAELIAASDPDFKGDMSYLERKATNSRNEAWGGITPKGPIYLQPNISHYTRG